MKGASFLIFLILASPCSALINEIMYNPMGADDNHEWIEIHNSGTQAIDLSGWKFHEAGTNHGLYLKQGSFVLEQGDYAVITEDWSTFLIDYPDFSGNLIDSTFSLSNTGEDLVIKDGSGNVIDNITYSDVLGGSENGFSIGLQNGEWKETFPSPGFQNEISDKCDWSVEIETEKYFFNSEDFEWKVIIRKNYGEKSEIEIDRWIKDESGDTIKDYSTLDYEITTKKTLKYSPNLKPGAYMLNAEIDPDCDDENDDNDEAELLIAIKGSSCEEEEIKEVCEEIVVSDCPEVICPEKEVIKEVVKIVKEKPDLTGLSVLIYESPQAKAEKLVSYFMIGLLTLTTLFLTFKKN
ncbi:lamin tail domain-containing protein [Nanoarchaeota archaeon]